MPPSTAVVAGALANKPGNGGEAWVRLSFALGLARLGFEVVFVEEIDPAAGSSGAIDYFSETTSQFGLDRVALLANGTSLAGLGREELLDVLSGAELLVNISGNLRDARLLEPCRRRVYVDVDPGYTQLWHAAGTDLGLAAHHHHVTVGAGVGRDGCNVPTEGVDWRYLPPPVVLDEWPVTPTPAGRFTTVGTWRGGYGREEWDDRLYGQKAHEFRKLSDLPRRAPYVFELAMHIDPTDEKDRADLAADGWSLVDPLTVAAGPHGFRRYIQQSGAELSAAQGIYVETRCGWVSDRTVRYLASGKPAVVQNTGLDGHVPLGEGLVAFRSVADAAVAAQAIVENYDAHCTAARRLAEELFDSDLVLGGLLADVGASP